MSLFSTLKADYLNAAGVVETKVVPWFKSHQFYAGVIVGVVGLFLIQLL